MTNALASSVIESRADTPERADAPKVKFSDASQWPNPANPHSDRPFRNYGNNGMLERMFDIGEGGDVC